MSNNYFDARDYPRTRQHAQSVDVRDTFNRIEAAFDKMPDPVVGEKGFDGGTYKSITITQPIVEFGDIGVLAKPASNMYTNNVHFVDPVTSKVSSIKYETLNGNPAITFKIVNSIQAFIPEAGGVVIGSDVALATTATDGFLHLPLIAGAPTGTPTTYTGASPSCVDETNGRAYFYYGGAWHYATLT